MVIVSEQDRSMIARTRSGRKKRMNETDRPQPGMVSRGLVRGKARKAGRC